MIPAHVKSLLQDVYGPRWGEAYLEWGLFNAGGSLVSKGNNGRAANVTPPDDQAVFWSVGLLKPGTGRANRNVETVKVFVVDDVGTAAKSKIDPLDLMEMPEPTEIIESSPGNYQWQWCFSDGMDVDVYAALRRSLPFHSDATAPSNLVRVPMGVTGKIGVTHNVRETHRGPVYTAEEFVRLCGGLKVTVAALKTAREALEAPSLDHVKAALKALPNDGTSPYCKEYKDGWIVFGMALYGATGGEGFDLWEEWCEPQEQKRDLQEAWDSFHDTGIGWVKLHWMAREYGKDAFEKALAEAAPGAFPEVEPGLTNAGLPMPAQLAYAREIVRMHGHRVRYNVDRGAWMEFDSIWRPHPPVPAVKLGFQLSSLMAALAPPRGKGEADLNVASFHDGVENFSRQARELQAREEDFDRAVMLLGSAAGTAELESGMLRAAEPGDMISKSTAVAPSLEEDCPRWKKFLKEVTQGDLASQVFLQQWAGYCLTGDMKEQKFLFLYGPGGNGKSVFADTLAGIMGDYAVKPVSDLFTKRVHGIGHTSKLAMLAGARLATISEVEAGSQWNEGLLKDITGGGALTAGFKHKNEFTFQPTFKLLILGNHQPTFPGGIDPAIRRRFLMMEFSFVPKVVDKDLMEKLRKEWPGILRWAINGTLEWKKTGLNIPGKVRVATDRFFQEQDLLGRWLSERLEKAPGAIVPATDLFKDWTEWRNKDGNHDLFNNPTAFGREVTGRGLAKDRDRGGIVYQDIKIRPKAPEAFDDIN